MTDYEFAVTGADDLARFAKALKRAGRTDLRLAMIRGLRVGAKVLIPLTQAAARSDLPHGGGLNEVMASAPQKVRVRASGRNPGVSIEIPGRQPGYLDGKIKHPVFERDKSARAGRKGPNVPWVTQQVDGDWFDGTIVDNLDRVLPELERAMDQVAEQIVREARG